MLPFIVSAGAVFLGALVQLTDAVSFGGAKVNLALVLVVVLGGIYTDWFRRWVLILIAAFILKFSPVIGWNDVIFIATLFLSVALLDYLPWQRIGNMLISVAAGTAILQARAFVLEPFIIELLLNEGTAVVVYFLFELAHAKTPKIKQNRFRRSYFG